MVKQRTILRFEIGDLVPIGLTLVVLGIGLAYGLNVLSETNTTLAEDTCTGWYNASANNCLVNNTAGNLTPLTPAAEVNASLDTIVGVAKIPNKLPLIATVIVAAVIIGILVRYLMVRFA